MNCNCGSIYVGEAGRTLELCCKEHKKSGKKQVDQQWYRSCLPRDVLAQEESARSDNTMNLDQGLQLNLIWSADIIHTHIVIIPNFYYKFSSVTFSAV